MSEFTVFVPSEKQGREAVIAYFEAQDVLRTYDIGTFVSFDTAEVDATDEMIVACAVNCAQAQADASTELYDVPRVTAEQGSVYPLEDEGVLLGWEVEFMI